MSCADAQILHYCLRPACLLCDGRFHSGLLSAHVSVAQMGSVRKAQFLDLIRFFLVRQLVQKSTNVSVFDLTSLVVAFRWSRGRTLNVQPES